MRIIKLSGIDPSWSLSGPSENERDTRLLEREQHRKKINSIIDCCSNAGTVKQRKSDGQRLRYFLVIVSDLINILDWGHCW